jgi:glycosyltransferase involved in cell wall biosynthesis
MNELFDNAPGPDITYYVPCLNEEKRVVGALDKIVAASQRNGLTFDIVVFDDGSTDQTSFVVSQYQARHPDLPIRLIQRSENKGLAHNFVDGAFYGKGKFYRTIAGDDYEYPESHDAILRELGAADILIPVYYDVTGKSLLRRVVSWLFTTIINLVSGNRIGYYNGFPVFRRWHVMRYSVEAGGFGFQADFICRLLNEGFTCKEIPLKATHVANSKAITLRNFLSVAHSIEKIFLRRLQQIFFGRKRSHSAIARERLGSSN